MPEYPTKAAHYGADRSVRSSTSPQPTESKGQHCTPHAGSHIIDMAQSNIISIGEVEIQDKTYDPQDKTDGAMGKTDDESFVVVNMDEVAHDNTSTERNAEIDDGDHDKYDDVKRKVANDKVPDMGALQTAERIKARGTRITVVHGVFH